MAVKTLPSTERLHQLFKYDPSTGELKWIERGPEEFQADNLCRTWNTRYANKVAGCKVYATNCEPGLRKNVVIQMSIGRFTAHSIIWKMVYGESPSGIIDHKNGDPWDNRIDNLRLATHRQNMQNKRRERRTKSGFKGVDKHGPSYRAAIRVNGATLRLGSFPTAEEAHAAYVEAAKVHFGEFARTG